MDCDATTFAEFLWSSCYHSELKLLAPTIYFVVVLCLVVRLLRSNCSTVLAPSLNQRTIRQYIKNAAVRSQPPVEPLFLRAYFFLSALRHWSGSALSLYEYLLTFRITPSEYGGTSDNCRSGQCRSRFSSVSTTHSRQLKSYKTLERGS